MKWYCSSWASTASCSFSCFSVKIMEVINVENFQGVSKVCDKYEDKTVKSVCNPNDVSQIWTKQESPTQNSTEAGPSWLQETEKHIICESLQSFFAGRGGIFLGEGKLHQACEFWKSPAKLRVLLKLSFQHWTTKVVTYRKLQAVDLDSLKMTYLPLNFAQNNLKNYCISSWRELTCFYVIITVLCSTWSDFICQ